MKTATPDGKVHVEPTACALITIAADGFSIGNSTAGRITLSREDGKHTFLVGEHAASAEYRLETKSPDWVLGLQWQAVTMYGLCQAFQDNEIDIGVAVVALPQSDIGLGAKLAARLVGRHSLNVDGKARSITIHNCVPVSQPYAGLCDFALGKDGGTKRNAFAEDYALIVDVGSRTMHVQPTHKMSLDAMRGLARDFGLFGALENIATDIRRKYDLNPSLPEITRWMQTGRLMVRGQSIPIGPISGPHLYPLLEVVINLMERIESPAKFNAVGLVGGGMAALLTIVDGNGKPELCKMIAKRFAEPTIAADPVGACALGAHKIARYLAGSVANGKSHNS